MAASAAQIFVNTLSSSLDDPVSSPHWGSSSSVCPESGETEAVHVTSLLLLWQLLGLATQAVMPVGHYETTVTEATHVPNSWVL